MENTLLDLTKNFAKICREKNIPIEAVLLSDRNGILFKEVFKELKARNIYSHSKSFASLIAGIAIDEGKLTLESRLVDLLNDEIDHDTYHRLFEIKLKHLLNMKSGFDDDLMFEDKRRLGEGFPDYTKFVLSHEVKEKPGTKFHYSNGDTFLVGRMVEKAYKQPFMVVAYEKFFKPLGMGLPLWETDCLGHTICATGLHLNIENMNMLGRLCLNHGMWNGKQIVSYDYIKSCSEPQFGGMGSAFKTNSGYSNQFWQNEPHHCYRADGAYGQLTFVFDKEGYTLSIQAPENGNLELLIKTIEEEILLKDF